MNKQTINMHGEKSNYIENAENVYIGISKSKLTNDEIINSFKIASLDLSEYQNKFGNIIHITRKETNDLLDWINSDLEEKDSNIALLIGNAGSGKSVITRDLYESLKQNNFPVLGIKADRLYIKSIEELNIELELGDTIESIFTSLNINNEKFVLLIDQIDALSQSLSSDRSSLNTYHRLINRLSCISNIRIIISCRIYDLDYDPILQEYKSKKIFRVSFLSVEEVKSVLATLNIQVNENAVKLMEFLRTPLHLQLFCKINKPSLFTEAVRLQDLYDEIWKEFIILKPNNEILKTEKVQELVVEISNQMYNNQQLIVNQKYFEGKYSKEIEYLSSEEIITKPDRNKIQFIHQSFFDYAYARTFVEKGESISDTIIKQHQGLFIRSRVKQVFSYLRELDSQLYIHELEEVLFGDYRFHIKLLLINNLGFYQNPLIEERKIVKEKISKNKSFFNLFIESVNSADWFNFIINDLNILESFVNNDIEMINRIYSLCHKMLDLCTIDVISFLEKLENITFENKFFYIGNILTRLNADKIELSFPLYYKTKDKWNNFSFYHYLELAIDNNPDFVITELREHVKKYQLVSKNSSTDCIPGGYEGSRVFKKIFEKYPDTAIHFLIEIINIVSNSTKLEYLEVNRNKDRYFVSMAYYLYTPQKGGHKYLHEEFYDWVLEYLKDKFEINFEEAKLIVLPLIDSDISNIINIPITFFTKYPIKFKEVIYKSLINKKVYTTSYELLNYNLGELIKISYSMFSSEEQDSINNILLQISPEWEKENFHDEKGVSKYGYTRIGYTSYSFIAHIPELERRKHNNISMFFNEKHRQYGEVKHKEPEGIVVRSGDIVLAKNAYEFMNDNQWIESLKKYISDSPFDWDMPTKTGHCRKFEDYVSNNPKRFVSLIDKIIDNEKVLALYCIYGLQGLKKANFNPNITKELFLKFIVERRNKTDFDREVLKYSIWFIEYFINNSIVDTDIINFLSELVINYEDEEMYNDDPINDGINRIRGAASYKLVLCYKFTEFKEIIFSSLESMSENGAVHTRAAALFQLAYLNNLDKERNLALFLKLLHDYHPLLLKMELHNTHPLLYLIHHDFQKLIDFFLTAIDIEESHKTLSHVLFIAWLHDYDKSEELLDKILSKSSISKQTVVKVAFNTIENKQFEDKCWEIINRFLTEKDEELGNVYEFAFLRIEKQSNHSLLEFLGKYVDSEIGMYRGHYFYKLLENLTTVIPEKCIEWCLKFENHEKPDIQKNFIQNEPLHVIIQSYNAIRDYNKENPVLESAMDAFDKLLEVPEYRGGAYDVLMKIDS